MCSLNNYGVWTDMPNELFVIGDIHGDFFALKQSLELTDCVHFEPYNDTFTYDNEYYYELNDGCMYYSTIKGNVNWKSEKKNCFIVFSGDIMDRCRPNDINNVDCINTVSDENCDLLLLKLLFDLDNQAKLYNSRVIVILGNHEIMNIKDEIKYVSLKGRYNKRIDEIKKYLICNLLNIYGIIRINKYIIVHGGVNDQFFDKIPNNDFFELIEIFNYKLRDFLLMGNDSFFDSDFYKSPFWDRTLGGRENLNKDQCLKIFDKNLLQIKNFDEIKDEIKIIVAHCPQFVINKTINLVDCQEFEDKIWRIDVGMSRAFDLYDMNKIIKNINKLSDMIYKDFFLNDYQNREVSCIKLTGQTEDILKGKSTIDYFYEQEVFKLDANKRIHIYSDIIKILIDNIRNNPLLQEEYIEYISKIKSQLP